MKLKRILVVDDEPGFTRLLKLNLEKTGRFEVRTVNQAPATLTAAREFKPDLILLDVVMPGMDGGDVLALLRQDPGLQDTPVLFLTATVSKGEMSEQVLTSGGLLFLAKPIGLDELVACIEKQLSEAAGPQTRAGSHGI
jgi:CheY-like chemotaxis protein